MTPTVRGQGDTMKRAVTFLVILLAGLPALAQQPAAAASGKMPVAVPPGTVALLDGKPISASDLDDVLGSRLLKVRQQEYQIKSDAIKEYAFKLLEKQQAAKEGISVDELYRRNVTAKLAEPSKDEVSSLVRRYRAQLPQDEEAARAQVVQYLTEQSKQQLEKEFRDSVLASAKLDVLLEPPRAEITIDKDDPVVGNPSAPVTLVEFSDFQCPYCRHSQETLKQLRTAYGDKLRMVFKQLPLPMHPQARIGAEAALCAQDQGKYWEMREWMFANQNDLKAEALTAAAKDAKLDADAFAKCLATHATAARIDRDLAEAKDLGATGTPTFFVDGRLLEGAQSYDSFREVIDQELARVGASAPTVAEKK
jgi:protein-disulfide isomerase